MDSQIEQFILKHRKLCEFPDKNGTASCNKAATRVVTIKGKRWNYQVVVCADCFNYADNEERILDERRI